MYLNNSAKFPNIEDKVKTNLDVITGRYPKWGLTVLLSSAIV